MPNTFKKGDVITVDGYSKQSTVDYTDGPFVHYDKRGCAHHKDCTLVLQPKFKVGDRVTHQYSGIIVYVVKDVRPEDGYLFFHDYALAGYCNPNAFSLAVPTIPAIVARKSGNAFTPSRSPRVHDSLETAKKEAERLAVKHPGVEFGTFVLASTSTATAPVAPTVTTVSV